MITYLISQIEDPDAADYVSEIFKQYRLLLFHTAQEFISDQFVKEDIVQDSLIKIIENLDTIRKLNCYTLPAYLVTIVRNTAINYLRHSKIVNDHILWVDSDELSSFSPNNERSMDDYITLLQNSIYITKIWPRLSKADQHVLFAYYYVELSSAEIAESLGCTENAVRMRLSRARKRVKAELIKEGVVYE